MLARRMLWACSLRSRCTGLGNVHHLIWRHVGPTTAVHLCTCPTPTLQNLQLHSRRSSACVLEPILAQTAKAGLAGFCAIFSRSPTFNIPPTCCCHPTIRHMSTTIARRPGCKFDLCAAVLMPHAEWHQNSKLSLKVRNFVSYSLPLPGAFVHQRTDGGKKKLA